MKKTRYIIASYGDKAFYLARSMRRKDESAEIVILYSDNIENKSYIYKELLQLSCIVVNADVKDIKAYYCNDEDCSNNIFLMDDDSQKNSIDALNIAKKLKKTDKLFIDAKGMASELIVDSISKSTGVYCRRMNNERVLIYNNIYRKSLFDLAQKIDGENVITVVIIGMNNLGIEMLKACIWCGQMDGYVLRIHVIGSDENIEGEFYYEAPEVKKRNGLPRMGEDYYEISFHGGIDLNTNTFCDTLFSIERPSWVLVSGESDIESLETAIRCREVYARQMLKDDYIPMHYSDSEQIPFIQVAIQSDEMAEVINCNGLENFKNQRYGIEAIGNVSSLWDIDNICNNQLEEMALKAHLKWGSKEDFDNHEYNRRSSVASAIHKKYRDEKFPDDNIMKDILEHRRWVAYMRSTEGYSFGLIRDDLAKQHNCLVKYNDLSIVEKRKDNVMNKES